MYYGISLWGGGGGGGWWSIYGCVGYVWDAEAATRDAGDATRDAGDANRDATRDANRDAGDATRDARDATRDVVKGCRGCNKGFSEDAARAVVGIPAASFMHYLHPSKDVLF